MLWLVCVKKAASTSSDVRDTMMRSWNTEPLVDAAWGPLDAVNLGVLLCYKQLLDSCTCNALRTENSVKYLEVM